MAYKSNFSMSSLLSSDYSNSSDSIENSPEINSPETVRAEEDIDVELLPDSPEEINDPERPQFTYISLITMAIRSSPVGKVTLNEIYNHIMSKFPYYQNCKTQWKNSIRHNLSINKIFVKVPREYGEHGRGHYWALSPEASATYIGEDTGRLRFHNYLNIPIPNCMPSIHQQNVMMQQNMMQNSFHTLMAQQNLMYQQFQQQQQQRQLLMSQASASHQQHYAEMATMSAMHEQMRNCCSRQVGGGLQPCHCYANYSPHYPLSPLAVPGSSFPY